MKRAVAYITLTVFITHVTCVRYHSYTGEKLSDPEEKRLAAAGVLRWCSVDVAPCSPKDYRRINGTCNNLHRPSRGASLTPYRRLLPPVFAVGYEHRTSSSGAPLPLERRLRTALIDDGHASSGRYTQLVTHLMVTVTGDLSSQHDTVNYAVLTTDCCQVPRPQQVDPRCQALIVPPDDPVLRYSDVRCLNLTRAITYQRLGCISRNLPPERINLTPPLLELNLVYGSEEESTRKGREGSGGLLKEETVSGRQFPPSGSLVCFGNKLPNETRCHSTPNLAINTIQGLSLVSLWWYRNHNRVARELFVRNPHWSDERLFMEAREINIASWQQIIYYELMPAIIGREELEQAGVISPYGGYSDDYDESLDPTVSAEYIYSTRWFHTVQEGMTGLYNEKGYEKGRRPVVEDTLRTGILDQGRTIEELTQGSFWQPLAAADSLVDPDMGERVLGGLQRVSDVISSDIAKGRDIGFPPYNSYRRFCGKKPATSFSDFYDTLHHDKVEELRRLYETPEDVDLMAGLLAERVNEWSGKVVGPTLACIIIEQLQHWRRSDRFWYESRSRPHAFTQDQLNEIRLMSMSRMLCDNGDDVKRIQPNPFLLPAPGNEIHSCNDFLTPNYDAWKETKEIDKNIYLDPSSTF